MMASDKPQRGLRPTARAAPTATRSFVVEVLEHDETPPEIIARITPTEGASTAAIKHGFRFDGPFMDVVSDFLVALAREDDDDDEK